jgi:transcriptional regulator with XRE-family HTH domain
VAALASKVVPMVSRSKSRRLGLELRKLREQTSMTIVDLGTQVGLSKSTISRIENGERSVSDTEIKTILGALGVTGSQRDALIETAEDAHKANWLAASATGLPEQLTTLVDYELSATRITEVSLLVMPGLLQIRPYSREIYLAADVPTGEIDTRSSIRLGRQEILTRDNPVEFHAIIDEAALRRPVGGRDVMVRQLQHVLAMAERPNVSVQVLPIDLGAHAAIDGSYVLLEFGSEPPVVHCEQYVTGTFVDDTKSVESYLRLTERVSTQALSPAESTGLVSRCLAELEST